MSYKSVKEIFNAVFDSDNLELKAKHKELGELLMLVYDEDSHALKVHIDGLSTAGGIIDGEVATYAELPDALEHIEDIYIVQTTTGIPLVNRKQAGLYRSDGAGWNLLDVSLTADKVYYTGSLSSTDVQSALDELKEETDNKLDSDGQATDSAKLAGMATGTNTTNCIPFINSSGTFEINNFSIDTFGIMRNSRTGGGYIALLDSDSTGANIAIADANSSSPTSNWFGVLGDLFRIKTGGDVRLYIDSLGNTYPNIDNSQSLGTASRRWSTVYAGTGAISTSDARMKTDVQPMSDAELRAAREIAAEIGIYKFLSAVETKGDSARQHIGLTVQRAVEIMVSCGLDPFAYGFICYDSWETEAIEHSPSEDQNGWTETLIEAGDRYSFRYDELNMFIIRGICARLDSLEQS